MGFAWSHTTYAKWKDMIFNFEDKWDLDYFLAHACGSERILAVDAWKVKIDFVKVTSSRRLGGNNERAKKVREWKRNVRTGQACKIS